MSCCSAGVCILEAKEIRECMKLGNVFGLEGLSILCLRSGLDMGKHGKKEGRKEGIGNMSIPLLSHSWPNPNTIPWRIREKPPLILPFYPAFIHPCQWVCLGSNNPFDPRPFIPDTLPFGPCSLPGKASMESSFSPLLNPSAGIPIWVTHQPQPLGKWENQ